MNLQQKKIIINYTKQIIYRTKKILKKLSGFIIWIIWDFSGVRFVWQKIRPPVDKPSDQRPPATFLLWIVSLYIILFGVTSQRYENRIDIIENRANAILVQLSTPVVPYFKNTISRIPAVQNMPCPSEPNILKPNSIFNSIFDENGRHEETVALLKETIVSFKSNLDSTNLEKVNLQGVILDRANFRYSLLWKADFRDTHLSKVDFQDSLLWKADFQGADFLFDVNFQGADLFDANLQGVDLANTNFQGAWCMKTNFKNVKNGEKLSDAKTLYSAELDPKLMKQMKKDYPHLFEYPVGYHLPPEKELTSYLNILE